MTLNQEIFIDPKLQNEFNKQGFVKLPVFDSDTIQYLLSIREKYLPDVPHSFFSSSYLSDLQLKKDISDSICTIVLPKLKNHFKNFRSIGAAFLMKGVGPQSEMPMHQDWTIVDESEYVALNVWIPLAPTSDTNGTIEVIPGSHLWHSSVRAPTIPFHYDGYQEQLKPLLQSISTKPGEVVVLNQAVVHYSKPNLSNEMRPAITAGIVSQKARLSFNYWNKEAPTELEVFEQEDDFLLRFNNFHEDIFNRPTLGKSLGKISYKSPQVDLSTISKKSNSISNRRNWIKKLIPWI